MAYGGRRGFAAMTPEQRKKIASMGGKAANEKGVAHKWTPQTASIAGRLGGLKSQSSRRRRKPDPDPEPEDGRQNEADG